MSGAERSIISEGAAEPGKAGKKKKKEKKEKKRKTKEKKEKEKKGWSLLVRILNHSSMHRSIVRIIILCPIKL